MGVHHAATAAQAFSTRQRIPTHIRRKKRLLPSSSTMIRVLHIASGDLWGGAEAQLNALARATAKLGAHVSVALLNRSSELERRLQASGISVVALDETKMSALRLTTELVKHVRCVRPNVIHTHRFKENILGTIVAQATRVPSIRTVHGAAEPELMGGGARRRILSTADEFTARYLQKRVVAVSKELAEHLAARVSENKLRIVDNGIDANALSMSASDSVVVDDDAGVCRIGYFGRLVPVKRLDLLLRSIASLRERHSANFKLYIVGEGPELTPLREMSAALRLENLVVFAGFQNDAAAWIRTMDCVVLTSDHEGLPMIVLESLALGVPVVARAVGGIPEVLTDIEACRLVADGSPESIAASIASVLNDRRERMTRASLLPLRYDAESMATAYMRVYREVVDNDQGS